VPHRSADIEHDEDARIGLTLVELDVQPVGSPEDVPVDAADFVARHVLPVSGEIDAESHVGRPVKALHETFDNTSSYQFQILNPDQNLRVDKACCRQLV